MSRIIFEGRFLVNVIGTVIRQDDLHIVHNKIDWERIFRIADYHKIANIIYLSILGSGETVPERWQNRFFERYQEALRFEEVCGGGEMEVLALFDMKEIPCIVLTSGSIRELYQIKETAANSELSLLTGTESYAMAKGFLVDLGYETAITFPGFGERMSRVSGITVEIYHRLPFRTRAYQRNMMSLMKNAGICGSYKHIRTLSAEDRFIYRMAQAAYKYAVDELPLREILDLFLYHKAWRSQMNESYTEKRLTDFHVNELSGKLLRISYMWFGTKEECRSMQQPEDMSVFDVLENRLLSQGTVNKETDRQALSLTQRILKDIKREKHRGEWKKLKRRGKEALEKARKGLGWIFPAYRYMCALYPLLEKIPVLLPFFWIVRGARFLIKALTSR